MLMTLKDAFERAQSAERRGDHERARGIYDDILTAVPEHPGALLCIAKQMRAPVRSRRRARDAWPRNRVGAGPEPADGRAVGRVGQARKRSARSRGGAPCVGERARSRAAIPAGAPRCRRCRAGGRRLRRRGSPFPERARGGRRPSSGMERARPGSRRPAALRRRGRGAAAGSCAGACGWRDSGVGGLDRVADARLGRCGKSLP